MNKLIRSIKTAMLRKKIRGLQERIAFVQGSYEAMLACHKKELRKAQQSLCAIEGRRTLEQVQADIAAKMRRELLQEA